MKTTEEKPSSADEAADAYEATVFKDNPDGFTCAPYVNGDVLGSAFLAGALWKTAQVAEAVKIVEDAREQCALMAEGEGDDPHVYMDIALYAMKRLDKALTLLKEVAK